jgi:hypothetical protein
MISGAALMASKLSGHNHFADVEKVSAGFVVLIADCCFLLVRYFDKPKPNNPPNNSPISNCPNFYKINLISKAVIIVLLTI